MSDDVVDNKPQQPSHIAYTVQEGRDGRNYWNRIGAAWEGDGEGNISVQVSAVPVDGRIVLRPREALEKMREQRKQAPHTEKPQQEIKP